ncbi:unnamed protein product, partial [Didymodactylos carnosus]
MTTDRMK